MIFPATSLLSIRNLYTNRYFHPLFEIINSASSSSSSQQTFREEYNMKTVPNYDYGNCAVTAIGNALTIPFHTLNRICRTLKYDCYEGLTQTQCSKLIRIFAKKQKKSVIFTKNTKKINWQKFIKTHQTGLFIYSLENHVGYIQNGVVYDGYIITKYDLTNLEGWWEIK